MLITILYRQATNEEITAAYRKASRIYHPDKHVASEEAKQSSEIVFNKIKHAYQVLIDPHSRAIYDTLGDKGLEQDGWKVISRTKTPQEIREEYERLMREKEERQLEQRTHPKGSITVNVNASSIFDSHSYAVDLYDDEIPWPEIQSMTISQSVEAPLTTRDTATLSGSLASKNGTGNGTVTASVRRVLNEKTWVETEFGAGQGPVFSLKAYRSLTKRQFATGSAIFLFRNDVINPAFQISKFHI